MADSPRRVCWDACTWIALIGREKHHLNGVLEDRYSMARSVIEAAEKGTVEIVVSGLCLPEVNKPSKHATKADIVAYFENPYIFIVPVDQRVGAKARDLMFASTPGLKPADAVHVATAIITNAAEMHTFDDPLLALDGKLAKLDGTPLKICKPSMGGQPLPLLAPLSATAKPKAGDGQSQNIPTAQPMPPTLQTTPQQHSFPKSKPANKLT